MELKRVHQCPSPVATRGVSNHAGGLVDDRQKLIFVDDLDRDVFGLGRCVGQIWEPNADQIAGADAVRGFDHAPIHQDGVGNNDLLDYLTGIVRETAGEVDVEPLALGSSLDLEFQRRFRQRRRPHMGP